MFSNNKRGFKMDHEALANIGLTAKEITQKHYRKILHVTAKSTIAGY